MPGGPGAPKRSRQQLIIGVAIAVIVVWLCCCGAAVALFTLATNQNDSVGVGDRPHPLLTSPSASGSGDTPSAPAGGTPKPTPTTEPAPSPTRLALSGAAPGAPVTTSCEPARRGLSAITFTAAGENGATVNQPDQGATLVTCSGRALSEGTVVATFDVRVEYFTTAAASQRAVHDFEADAEKLGRPGAVQDLPQLGERAKVIVDTSRDHAEVVVFAVTNHYRVIVSARQTGPGSVQQAGQVGGVLAASYKVG